MGLDLIISGGQTGADQGGLRAARRRGIPTGGWAPAGFLTENGPEPSLADEFGLQECDGGYDERTVLNAEWGDGTVIFARDLESNGSRLTLMALEEAGKPYLLNPAPKALAAFVREQGIRVLNVAGNRESLAPGIGNEVEAVVFEAAGLVEGDTSK
jgi:hypothetical protein